MMTPSKVDVFVFGLIIGLAAGAAFTLVITKIQTIL